MGFPPQITTALFFDHLGSVEVRPPSVAFSATQRTAEVWKLTVQTGAFERMPSRSLCYLTDITLHYPAW